jgi:CheY-like chemotaxis protein
MDKPILLVEDEEHDVLFMRLAMEGAGVRNPLIVVDDGQQAISYLSGSGKFEDRQRYPLPGLVLLDLKLPEIPGLEVLKWIREHSVFDDLPVIVFSSSNQEFDVENAYRLGANAYLVKPAYRELLELVRRIKLYWLDMDAPPLDCIDWASIVIPPPRNGTR